MSHFNQPPLSNNPNTNQLPALARNQSQEQFQRIIVHAPKDSNYRPRHRTISAEELEIIKRRDREKGVISKTLEETNIQPQKNRMVRGGKYAGSLNPIVKHKLRQKMAENKANEVDEDVPLIGRQTPSQRPQFVQGNVNVENPREINQSPRLNIPVENKTVINNSVTPVPPPRPSVRQTPVVPPRNRMAAPAPPAAPALPPSTIGDWATTYGGLMNPSGCKNMTQKQCFGNNDSAAARASMNMLCGLDRDVRWNYRAGKFVCAKKATRSSGGRKKRKGGKKSGVICVRVTGAKSCRRKKSKKSSCK